MRPFQREHTFMARLTILLGIALIILGLGGYFGTGRESATALIPVLFGLPLIVLGLLALRDAARKVGVLFEGLAAPIHLPDDGQCDQAAR